MMPTERLALAKLFQSLIVFVSVVFLSGIAFVVGRVLAPYLLA